MTLPRRSVDVLLTSLRLALLLTLASAIILILSQRFHAADISLLMSYQLQLEYDDSKSEQVTKLKKHMAQHEQRIDIAL